MATGKWMAALVGISALAAAPAAAHEAGAKAKASAVEARERATNRTLLAGLLKRPAEVLRSADAGGRRSALAFLDRQIAKVRSDLKR